MSFKCTKTIASGSQKKLWNLPVKADILLSRTLEKKTAALNFVFMHNLSGKVQLAFLFMRNLLFSLKLFLFQKHFFSFFVSQAEPQARERKKNMLPEKWYIMFHTGEG